MREILAEAVTAGALLLSPHPLEQPATTAEPASHTEIVIDSESLAAHVAQPESLSLPPIGSDPTKDAVKLHIESGDAPPPHSDTSHNVAILESLDPNTLSFWIEVGAGGLGLSGIGGLIARRRLRKSLRKAHTTIKDSGWEAQTELNKVLGTATQQAAGLREDDVPKLRELIEKHGATSTRLLGALGSTDPEFDAEHSRFFPLKRRLRRAPDTGLVIKTTQTAAKQAQALQREVGRVRTMLIEIDGKIEHAGAAVAGVREDLDALIEKGWDVSAYEHPAASLADEVAIARVKRADNYIDEPTNMASATIGAAATLKEKVAALEPRRTAADEAYGTQAGRLTAAEATADTTRGRFARLQDTYSEACMVDFENLQDELAEALTTLTSAHETGDTLTGRQGLSVEAVERSEGLNQSFDRTVEEIQVMEANLREREEHLAKLARQLPRKVAKLSARFDRAVILAADPDVEGETADEIRSLAEDVASLSASISMADGQRPDYLGVEQRHRSLAEEVARAHSAATEQKQEMDDLRTNIPELVDGYNGLLKVMTDFANNPKVRIYEATWSDIKKLRPYKFEMASDRRNLRQQHSRLERLLKDAHNVMRRAAAEADEDGLLLKGAKIAGATALALIGIDLLD